MSEFVGFPGEPEPSYSDSSDALEHEFRKLAWSVAQRRFRAQYPEDMAKMEKVAAYAAQIEGVRYTDDDWRLLMYDPRREPPPAEGR